MRTIEELWEIYGCKPARYSKHQTPEPLIYKNKMVSHLMTDELTLDEYDRLNKHYLKIKKDWQDAKQAFKATLLNMPHFEQDNTDITQQ